MSRQFKMAVSSADDAPNTAPLLLLGSIRDNLITAAKMGYDAIEIHMRENAQPDFEEIAATCAKHKVKISAVVSGRLAVQENVSITDEDPMKREKAVSGLYDYITLAQKLETDIIIGWIRGKTCAPRTKKQYNDLLAHSLKPLSDEAKKKKREAFYRGDQPLRNRYVQHRV